MACKPSWVLAKLRTAWTEPVSPCPRMAGMGADTRSRAAPRASEPEPGASLEFDQVLLVGDGDKISVGRPTVKGASVSAEIVKHLRGEKIKIFKFKRRREYRRRRGYRSELTRIRVTAISG